MDSNFLNLLKTVSDVAKAAEIGQKVISKGYTELYCQGIETIGNDFSVKDYQGKEWTVAVRKAGTRGRYIKLTSGFTEIRACVDGYKPEKYKRISAQEWDACASRAQGNKGSLSKVHLLINRLTKME